MGRIPEPLSWIAVKKIAKLQSELDAYNLHGVIKTTNSKILENSSQDGIGGFGIEFWKCQRMIRVGTQPR